MPIIGQQGISQLSGGAVLAVPVASVPAAPVPAHRGGRARRIAALCGPAFVVSVAYVRRRVPLVPRRLVTMVPAFALLATGADPMRLLIVSQVALSVGLPSVLIPLVVLTSRRTIMGALVNRRVTTAAAIVVTAAVIGLNGVLLCLAVTA